MNRIRRTMARRASPAGRVEPHASQPQRQGTPPGQPARPRRLRRMVHPGPSGSRQRRNRPELVRSHHHDASAAHDARTRLLPHTVQLCTHCQQNPAGFWVSRNSGQTVRRPWWLSCCQQLDPRSNHAIPFDG